MGRKILTLITIIVLLVVSTTPALAKKPVEPNGNGNSSHDDQRNTDNNGINNRNLAPASPTHTNAALTKSSIANTSALTQKEGHGFDEAGYNDRARIFNGTVWAWCMDKVGIESWCQANYGDYANDHLVMKWNAEWDRGNAENWSNPPYDAWLNNQFNGKFPGGSDEIWHYKFVWVGPCTEGEYFPNGGYCLWSQFEVLMDQGTADGVHSWLAHAKPGGYGSYP